MDPQQPSLPPVPQVPLPPVPHGLGVPWWIYGQGLIYGWPLLILQLACLVHAVRTGRPYWWFWIIMAFPLLGALLYLFVEVRPSLGPLDWQAILWRFKSPRDRVRVLESSFEESPTTKRCIALAAELRSQGMHGEACDVLSSGLVGPFQNDTTLLLLLADAHLDLGEPHEAQECLDRCTEQLRNDEETTLRLYRARILSMTGRFAEAEPIFQGLMKGRRSESPCYHFAEALLQAGRSDEAAEILDDILKRYRRGTPVYRNLEREWFLAARRLRKQASADR